LSKQVDYLIIGNGIAGVTAAEVLRAEDANCTIAMIADEPYPAYYRPALKDYLAGRVEEKKLWARPSTFYQQQQISFIRGRVIAVHHTQHSVQLSDGRGVGYRKLLLAHGAKPRQLSCPGLTLTGVTTLRTVDDYQRVVRYLPKVKRIVVCGSGTLALESAETLVQRGYEVIHLLRHSTLWSEVLDVTASDMVLQEERRLGIDVRTNEEIAEIVGEDGKVSGVVTSSGESFPCEMVLIAIGIEPNIDFVQQSRIACQLGIQVDAAMRTSVRDVFAAGDVTETVNMLTGRPRVLGQWYPAIQQAQTAAYNMLNEGETRQIAFVDKFYNATFLCGLDFVSIGATTQLTNVPRFQEIIAPPQPRSYRKVLLRNGIPVGILFLGEREHALAFKRAIEQQVNLLPVVHRLFAEDFSLDDYLDKQQEANMKLVPIPHANVQIAASEIPLSHLRGRDTVTIGRDPAMSVKIEHRSVSRRHVEIMRQRKQYELRDIGSSNGTFINAVRLDRDSVHVLQPQDVLRLGDVQFRVQAGDAKVDNDIEAQRIGGLTHRTDTQSYTEEQIRFELDMCIGCDRCMAACPVPLSSQVNITDLNSATGSSEVLPHVARFTHECVMCGSCVPVCPVDNHRDLLMLSLKQRLGPSWEERIDLQRLAHVIPHNWTLLQLIARLREQPILADEEVVPDSYLQHILASSQLLTLPKGEYIYHEDEYGRDLYFILDGLVALTMLDEAARKLPVAIHRYDECIGEYGMLTGQPYTTTAKTQTTALLLRVPEQVMQRLMELSPSVRTRFERVNHSHSTLSILKQMTLFQGVSDSDLQYLVTQTDVQHYERNAQLFTEERGGRPARETLHILLEGFVKVARTAQSVASADERILAYRQGGDYFAGGLDLLGDGRAVTVTSITRTRVAEIPHRAVQALFQRYAEVQQRFALRLQEYVVSTVSLQMDMPVKGSLKHIALQTAPPDTARVNGLHAIVSDGIVEGTEVLLIDLDKCIHCSECEEACERRHGHSRMNRKGMVIGNISIATACRQCQDPVCLLCSRAGIARLPDGEVYITESCIGCGICAERCPYEAISIVDADEDPTTKSSWQRFSAIFKQGIVKERKRPTLPVLQGASALASGVRVTSGPLNETRDAYEEIRKKIAIKCDLCAGYKNQACVEACPTGAAIRVQPTAFFGSTEEILQR
jgi:NADPH-dependent 2,4-dienoyl-CoA reductase/sulfur reductase-like enzyme/Fe-S-cluster-containing hydrogenase component 2/CRP-like cAMP-binding protein